jgi:tetratricopeptide (TPR) repeat protein
MVRTLVHAVAALCLAAPLHDTLLSQRSSVAQAGKPSESSMAMLPMASSSAPARMHAMLGQRALETNHFADAAGHFAQAIAADSTMAFAWLGAANASTSFAEYDANLKAAARLAEHASRAEQLQIEIARKGLVNDLAGAEALARELVTAEPRNPRAYLTLASAQQQMGHEVEARGTMERAIAVAPNFSPAYRQLAYSYMTVQPTDAPKAGPFVQKLVALEPTEAGSFVTEGSYFRAMNELPRARSSYTRAAELDPTMALPLGQRGHVASFIGDYDAARADYDAAAKLAKQNDAATFRMYRALVAVHAGDPKRGIAELDRLVGDVDGMHLADPLGAKIQALDAERQVAIESGDFATAARAIAQRAPLARQQVAGASDEKTKQIAEGTIAYEEGLLAARKGDAATAKAKADEVRRLLAGTSDPQKDQAPHAILGVLALEQKDFKSAASHLAQANPNDVYLMYERAVALEGAGRSSEAKVLFTKVSRFNFNSPDVAFVRREAAKRLH